MRGKRTYLIIGLLLLSLSVVQAQYDTLYIKTYPDRFYIKPLFLVRSAAIELKAKNGSNFENVRYSPNGNSYYGVAVYLFGINIELSTKLPSSLQRSAEEYGKTKSFDIQSNIYTRKIGIDFTYQTYKGFYLNNPKNHYSNWQEGNPYPQRGDLNFENLYFNVFYIFNHKKFSFRSSYNQAETQLKRAGSPIATFSFNDSKIKADSTLFPDETKIPQKVRGIEFADLISYSFLGGYSYNFVFRNFYTNATASFGPGIQSREIRPDFIEEHVIVTFVTNIRLALGYNSDRFFGGIAWVYQTTGSDLDLVDLNTGASKFKIFTGVRFNEKGILLKELF